MADPRIRQLRIKTGVIKRNYKEMISYNKEAEQIQEKIRKMQDDDGDVFYIKKQDGLLQETNTVIADCQKRVNTSYQELLTLVDNESELKEAEEYIAAKSMLKEAKPYFTN